MRAQLDQSLLGLAFKPDPRLSIDDNLLIKLRARLPKNWKEGLARMCFGASTRGLGPLEEYIGNSSTYTLKKDLEEQLHILYFRFSGQLDERLGGALPEVERLIIAGKIAEQLACPPGFHARVNEVIATLVFPDSLGQLLHMARESLVSETAARLAIVAVKAGKVYVGNEVHAANAVVNFAAREKTLGVRPRFENDGNETYVDEKLIIDGLIKAFKINFTPYQLPVLICNQLRTLFMQVGYVGRKSGLDQATNDRRTEILNKRDIYRTADETAFLEKVEKEFYSGEVQNKIEATLKKIAKLPDNTDFLNLFIVDDSTYLTLDINWDFIHQTVFKLLINGRYIDPTKLTPSELVDYAVTSDSNSDTILFSEAVFASVEKLFQNPEEGFKKLNAVFPAFPRYCEKLFEQKEFLKKFIGFSRISHKSTVTNFFKNIDGSVTTAIILASLKNKQSDPINFYGLIVPQMIVEYMPQKFPGMSSALEKNNITIKDLITNLARALKSENNHKETMLHVIAKSDPDLLAHIIMLAKKHTEICDAFAEALCTKDGSGLTALQVMAAHEINDFTEIIDLVRDNPTIQTFLTNFTDWLKSENSNNETGLYVLAKSEPDQLDFIIKLAENFPKINDYLVTELFRDRGEGKKTLLHEIVDNMPNKLESLICFIEAQDENLDNLFLAVDRAIHLKENSAASVMLAMIIEHRPSRFADIITRAKMDPICCSAFFESLILKLGDNIDVLQKILSPHDKKLFKKVIELVKDSGELSGVFFSALATKNSSGETRLQYIVRMSDEIIDIFFELAESSAEFCGAFANALKNDLNNVITDIFNNPLMLNKLIFFAKTNTQFLSGFADALSINFLLELVRKRKFSEFAHIVDLAEMGSEKMRSLFVSLLFNIGNARRDDQVSVLYVIVQKAPKMLERIYKDINEGILPEDFFSFFANTLIKNDSFSRSLFGIKNRSNVIAPVDRLITLANKDKGIYESCVKALTMCDGNGTSLLTSVVSHNHRCEFAKFFIFAKPSNKEVYIFFIEKLKNKSFKKEFLFEIIDLVKDDFLLLSLCVESLENPFEFKSKHKSNFFAMDTALQEGYMRYRSILDSISAAGDELKKNYLSESGAGTITKIKLGRASTKNQEVFSILKAAAMSDPTGAASKVLNNTLKSALEKYRKQPGDEKVVSPTDCF